MSDTSKQIHNIHTLISHHTFATTAEMHHKNHKLVSSKQNSVHNNLVFCDYYMELLYLEFNNSVGMHDNFTWRQVNIGELITFEWNGKMEVNNC